MQQNPFALGEELEGRVERHQDEAVHRVLDNQLNAIHRDVPKRLELRKSVCVVLLARCFNGAVRSGAPRQLLQKAYWSRLTELTRLRSWVAIREHVHAFADEMLLSAKREHRTNIVRTVDLMRHDLRETLSSCSTLDEYAATAGVSREHLSRCFTKMVGRSYRDELCDARLKKACQLLRETPLKVRVIALHVGLRDPSQFIAEFRRHVGMPPGAFRKSHHSSAPAAVPPTASAAMPVPSRARN